MKYAMKYRLAGRRCIFVLAAVSMVSYWAAVNLFRDIRGQAWSTEVLSATLGILLASRLVGLLSAGLPNSSLRYPSSSDVLRVIRGVSIGSVLFLIVSRIAHFRHELPAALFVLDAAILVSLWGLLHCGVRLLDSLRAALRTKGKRVLIVGAGDAGMILTLDSRPEKREAMAAAIHPYDATGRPQEVYESWNPDYHRLISHFEQITGEAIILNTSFNLHGEPVVCSPEDALRVFDISGLEHLALGDFLLAKK